MKHTAKKALKIGYGLGLLSVAQAKKLAVHVKKELDLNDTESTKLARALVAQSRKASEDVLKTIGGHFEKAVVKSGIAKKSELKVVKSVLKRRMKNAMTKKGAGKRTTKRSTSRSTKTRAKKISSKKSSPRKKK